MREQSARRRYQRQLAVSQAKRAVQPTARPGGIDHEAGVKPHRPAVSPAAKRHAVRLLVKTRQFSSVKILDAEPLRLVDQVVIEVGAKPVRVGDLVARAGSNEELVSPLLIVAERLAKRVVKKGKPALEAAADSRVFALPLTPAAERQKLRQVVFLGELLQQQIGQRRGRLADREARMRATLDQHDRAAQPPRHHRHQRPAKTAPHNRYVRFVFHSVEPS